MRHFLSIVSLVMACETGEAADSASDAWSQSNLAAMYPDGQSVPKDSQEAVRAWQRAAEQGDAEGQYNLGLMYDKGQGVAQDFIRAYMWYHLAAEALSGDDAMVARKLRDRMASLMTTAQLEKAREMARHCRQSKFKECD